VANFLTFENASKVFLDLESFSDGSVCVAIKNGEGEKLYWLEPEDVEKLMDWLQLQTQEELSE
jgi:hypothetical protein